MNGIENQGALSLITTLPDLPPALAASVSAGEGAYIAELRRQGLLPFAVTPHFASLASPEPDDPIRRQFFPDPRESAPDPLALDDPLGEARHRAAPRLIHQYPNRALLLAGGSCAGYCRHCFRRVWLSEPQGFIGNPGDQEADELAPVLNYLRQHREIREILVSGGDPLVAEDGALASLFQKLRTGVPGTVALRLCTRVPITWPQRIGADTIAMLSRFRPLRMAIHLNHPRELSPASRTCLAAVVAAGIPVLVQTVLLRGINDDPNTLAALVRECQALSLIPYYLFQLDLAPGTAHFRVPLRRGLAIYRDLLSILAKDPPPLGEKAAPATPVYAVDLPGGGGKIRLSEEAIAGEDSREGIKVLLLKHPDGTLWPYPADE
jgi:lysine 2,3-aminomutase